MSRKTVKKETEEQKNLSVVEKFYIEGHRTDDVNDIAKELQVDVNLIIKHIKSINSSLESAGFAVKEGSVVLTKRGSEISDDIRKSERKAREDGTLQQKVPKNAFLIDPTKPIR